MNRTQWIRLSFTAPIVLYMALFYAYPLYYSFRASMERYDLIGEITGRAPFVGLSNYAGLFADPIFRAAAIHSLLFTVGSLVPQFLIGLALALFFTKRFPLSRPLRALLLFPWLLPLVVSGTVWRWLFDETNGVIDQTLSALHLLPAHFGWLTTAWSLAAVIVANIWIGIPFNMALLHTGLQGIPEELNEASAVDGATPWQRFTYVTLPMLRPVIAIVLMLGFVYTLKVFDVIYVITGGGPANMSQTFATWSYNLSFSQQLFGQGAAVGNTILLISVIVSLGYLRWFSTPPDSGKAG